MSLFQDNQLQVSRLNLGIFVMHPEFAGLAYQRTDNDSVLKTVEIRHQDLKSPVYKNSPVHWAVSTKSARHWDLEELEPDDFDFLHELRTDNCTGYAVIPLFGTHRRVHVLSLATKQPGGFSADQWKEFQEFARQLAMLVDTLAVYHLAEVMLGLYVGKQTGSRVLSGAVQRGQGDIIEAVVLVSDMKGYTQLCANISSKETIDVLNQFFERICLPIEEKGGEILKFMGDAVLAIFPSDGDPIEEACRRALVATRLAHQRLRETPLTLTNGSPLQVTAGFALHVGQFHYGNIGTSSRLDFTAIGPAVNLASRIESKSRSLDTDILCTKRFADLAGVTGKNLGFQRLKGIPEPIQIIGLIRS